MSVEDAMVFVKTQREETDPNEGFLEQLKRFEANGFQFLDEAVDENLDEIVEVGTSSSAKTDSKSDSSESSEIELTYSKTAQAKKESPDVSPMDLK